MNPDLHITHSLALTFRLPMALVIREVVLLRRERPGPDGDAGRAGTAPAPPQPRNSAPPLPACLILRDRPPVRARSGRRPRRATRTGRT